MPDTREKLIELLNNSFAEQYEKRGLLTAPHTATDLIANGVRLEEKQATSEESKRWIPVTERLPDLELVEVRTEDMDLFPCLVVKSAPQSPKKRFVTKAWYDGKGFMDTDCIWITKSVTHWMPLPEPPKEVNNG